MTSHEYADKLMKVVRLLQTSKEFEMPNYTENCLKNNGVERIYFHYDKELFLAAVRALGSGRKVVDPDDDHYVFAAGDGTLHLCIYRSEVCKLVKPAQPAEYECEPLLTPQEEAQVGVGPAYVEEVTNG